METDPTTQRIGMALRTVILSAGEQTAHALRHVVWSVASWARRKPDGDHHVRIQVSLRYVCTGAGVGRKAAERALEVFSRWTGSPRSRGGWLRVREDALEATWRVLQWLLEENLLEAPQVAGAVLEPLFITASRRRKDRGKAPCGCGAHLNGDRDPSLAYDLHRGLATCQKTREVFVVREERDRLLCYRIHRGDGVISEPPPVALSRDTKDTSLWGGEVRGDPSAGSPGNWPESPGLVNGGLWDWGCGFTLSGARSRSSWARWQENRWGGESAERGAWEASALAQGEGDGNPRRWFADRFVGVGWWTVKQVRWIRGSSGRIWPEVEVHEQGTGHVLFDLDGIEGGVPVSAAREVVDGVVRALEGNSPLLENVEWIMRTSGRGLQVMVRLRRFRWDVRGFYSSPAVVAELERLARVVEGVVGSGQVDRSAWAPGRMGRAPGWRVKGSLPELASIWYLRGEEEGGQRR